MIKIIHKLFFTLISTIWIVIIYGIDQKWNFLNQSIFLTDVCYAFHLDCFLDYYHKGWLF